MDSVNRNEVSEEEEEVWVRRESKSRPGNMYYHNKKTGVTTWRRPSSGIVKDYLTIKPPQNRKRSNEEDQSTPARKLRRQDLHVNHTFESSNSNSVNTIKTVNFESKQHKTDNSRNATVCVPDVKQSSVPDKSRSNTGSIQNSESSIQCDSSQPKGHLTPITSQMINKLELGNSQSSNQTLKKNKRKKRKKKKPPMAALQNACLELPIISSLSKIKDFNTSKNTSQNADPPKEKNTAESRMSNIQKVLTVFKTETSKPEQTQPAQSVSLSSDAKQVPAQSIPIMKISPVSKMKASVIPQNVLEQIPVKGTFANGFKQEFCPATSRLESYRKEISMKQKSQSLPESIPKHPPKIAPLAGRAEPPVSHLPPAVSSHSDMVKGSCPAANRLKMLQNRIAARQKELQLFNSASSHTSQSTFVETSSHKPPLPLSVDLNTVQHEGLQNVFSRESYHIIKTGPDTEEFMDVDYPEVNVLNYIYELRKNDISIENYQPSFMEWDDITQTAPALGSKPLYIVLDTNVLLSNLKTVKALRDSTVPGKGPTILYLPWQVLQELDRIKDHGKTHLKSLARVAISFLHDNFSSKHPRVRGQKYPAKKSFTHCPDDNILQACLDLTQQGNDVILLSNDKNLCNKGLVCGVSSVSNDGIKQILSGKKEETVTSSNSSNELRNTKSLEQNENATPAMFSDSILCELKSNIKKYFSEIVASGMEEEYGVLWKKRTIVPPPWEADDALRCLSQHVLPICGDTCRDNVVSHTADRLVEFLKFKIKKFGISLNSVQEAIQSTLALYDALPEKYSCFSNPGKKDLENLYQRSKSYINVTTSDKATPPKDVVTPADSSSDSLRSRSFTVLVCFEMALRAATEICNMKNDAEGDITWRLKADNMLVAVQKLIKCISFLLSSSDKQPEERNAVVSCLLQLIKGDTDLTEFDLINFSQSADTRNLLINGLQQFIDLERVLGSSSGF